MKTLILVILSSAQLASAAVIFSSCPVRQTAQPSLSADRFAVGGARRELRHYGKDLSKGLYYLAWMLQRDGQIPFDPKASEESARAAGLWMEDLQLFMNIAETNSTCQSDPTVLTEAKAIFPFALKGTTPLRIRYKLCEYYVDQQRQIPYDDCREILGSPDGYTLAQLESRFQSLGANVERTQQFISGSAYAASLLAVLPTFRAARIARISGGLRAFIGFSPVMMTHFAVKHGWTEELLREAIDLQQTAEVAMTGDLSTSVQVAQPIQEFAPYFRRYLESIH